MTDWILAFALVGIAWRLFQAPDLFASIVLYIVFGLLLSLVWVRLGAPDVALAEAAIGAGVTGALLLDAGAELELRGRSRAQAGGGAYAGAGPRSQRASALARTVLTSFALLALLSLLLTVVSPLNVGTGGLRESVAAAIDASGVSHPVTAVLLNFRALDTLLELGVLLIAAVGVLTLHGRNPLGGELTRSEDPVVAWLVRLLVPMIVLAAGYFLWLGTHAPGGAFQAGALLASAGLLLILTGRFPARPVDSALLRVALSFGLAALALAAILSQVGSGTLLQWPTAVAAALIMMVETSLALSIGATLVALFAGARPPDDRARVGRRASE